MARRKSYATVRKTIKRLPKKISVNVMGNKGTITRGVKDSLKIDIKGYKGTVVQKKGNLSVNIKKKKPKGLFDF